VRTGGGRSAMTRIEFCYGLYVDGPLSFVKGPMCRLGREPV
jgi:hypothetical protein